MVYSIPKRELRAKSVLGRTALIRASHEGHAEVVQASIAARADVNAKESHGATALFMASQEGHADVVAGLAHREGR